MASNENCKNTNGTVAEKAPDALLPHFETIDRLLSLPMCSFAWSQSQGVYGKVKGQSFSSLIKITHLQLIIMSFYECSRIIFQEHVNSQNEIFFFKKAHK